MIRFPNFLTAPMRRPAARPQRRPRLFAPRFAGLRSWIHGHSLAMVAIVLQVLLLTDHLGATAIAEAGRAQPGAQMGLLQICTGEGIVYMTPAGEVVTQPGAAALPGQTHTTVHSQCAVCGSASVCSFDAPDGVSTPVLAAMELAPLTASLERPAIHLPERRSSTPIRGPPRA